MSDPVTNAQIEDVLSSIRRLVSDDGRPVEPIAPPKATAERPSESTAAKADRLVLTPALRVTEAENTAMGAEEAATPPSAPTVAAGADPAPWSAPDATLFATVGEEAPEDEAVETGTAVDDDTAAVSAAPSEPAPDLDPPHLDLPLLDAPEAGDDAVSADDAADEVADETGQMPDAGPWAAFPDKEGEFADQSPTFHSTRAENLSAKIEVLEAVIGRTRDQWEPDGTSDDAYAGTPVEGIGWHEVEDDTAQDIDEESDDLATDEAVIDEDSLRELVAEIVRQELQGALGERITRNVRKLVRREIHRVLAAQDLD
ncbi:hypothetical protein [Aquicoccus sp. SU-CL01552]|uniref:hypothetical protein n=1 Tax=Aquicoccus sp. SU-CL01552 TaxID=3127656 RepID=UPI00310658DC